ncbi:hypothetical protein SAY87_016686 [Trapa incisa]|uniref:Uncharacterized protein n=1 Tax=Trapa incisa TaxID=236973 RepID=A0AAN7LG36_9MYRT|nr:hypothetical protein SAY87_016686 [Trapa incisa]
MLHYRSNVMQWENDLSVPGEDRGASPSGWAVELLRQRAQGLRGSGSAGKAKTNLRRGSSEDFFTLPHTPKLQRQHRDEEFL